MLSNVLGGKHFCNLLPKGTGNFECQLKIRMKSTVFNGVDGLARHTYLGGKVLLGTIPAPRVAPAYEF
jgi:hypothetical protein